MRSPRTPVGSLGPCLQPAQTGLGKGSADHPQSTIATGGRIQQALTPQGFSAGRKHSLPGHWGTMSNTCNPDRAAGR